MSYDRSEFFRLMEQIEGQGGEHLDKIHEHDYHTNLVGGHVEDVQRQFIANCNASNLVKLPYYALVEPDAEPEVRAIEVCLVDDMLGNWPRFADAQACHV